MPLVAQVANPAKKFAFKVLVDGLLAGLVQKVQLPDAEVEKIEHGDANMMIKTPGKLKYGDLVIEKLISGSPASVENWGYDWLKTVQHYAGGGLPAPTYAKVVTIQELDSSGLVVIRTHVYTGCWVCKVEQGELDATSGENRIEKVTLAVHYEV